MFSYIDCIYLGVFIRDQEAQYQVEPDSLQPNFNQSSPFSSCFSPSVWINFTLPSLQMPQPPKKGRKRQRLIEKQLERHLPKRGDGRVYLHTVLVFCSVPTPPKYLYASSQSPYLRPQRPYTVSTENLASLLDSDSEAQPN